MKKSHKYIIIISSCSLLLLTILERNIFIKKELINWSAEEPLSWENFNGYPVFFTKYGAAISSYFNYDFCKDTTRLFRVETIMYANHSWALPSIRESQEILRHEQYHFNISEVIARKFRKTISELSDEELNDKKINQLYRNHIIELNAIQRKYDADTEHGLLIERQKDWEYLVDSMLICLEHYKNPEPFKKNDVYARSPYYRQIEIDAFNRIRGKYPIDSIIASKTKHYRFFYTGNAVNRIEYWNRNKPSKDEKFEVAVIKLDRKKDLQQLTFFDSQGNPTTNSLNVHMVKYHYTGTSIIQTNFNIDCNPVNDNNAVHKTIWELDYRKRRHIAKFYDLSGNQITEGDGYYIRKQEYDKRNNVIEKANYNENKKLMSLPNGIALFKYNYDRNNNLIDYYTFDEHHKLTPHEGKMASRHYKYDLNGNILFEYSRDKNGDIIVGSNGAAYKYLRYDIYSNLVDKRLMGINKNLIINESNIGRVIYRYDSLGRVIVSKNYDAYDRLMNDEDGICMRKFSYNTTGSIENEDHYYSDSLFNHQFLRKVSFSYHSGNLMSTKSYFDSLNHPITDTSGVHKIVFDYDQRDNLIQIDHFDLDGKLKAIEKGVARFSYTYDDRNNKIQTAYYDEKGNLTETKNNIAIDRYKYNSDNLLIERSYYNAKNELTTNDIGVCIIEWKHDENGNAISEIYYDQNRKRTTDNNGIFEHKYEYNSKNQYTATYFFNKNNELVSSENDGIAKMVYRYNDQGNHIQTVFFDKNDNLKNSKDGYAIEEYKHDKLNNHIKTSYFSEYGSPVVTAFGYASVEWVRDKNGNVIAEICRDENKCLIENKEGCAVYNWIHDRNGNVVESYAYGADFDLSEINYGPFYRTAEYYFPFTAHYDKTDNKTRTQNTYYTNGQLESQVTYIDGKLEGSYTSWYETGELQNIIEYRDGKRHGRFVEYYENGNRKREMYYENNIMLQESQITWYESGALRSKYVDGELVEWDENGKTT